MQSVAPASGDHNPNSHTEEEILSELRGRFGTRHFSFRYDLLDSTNEIVDELAGSLPTGAASVVECKIDQNWFADIKRKASFTILDDGRINYLSDRIRPWVRLHIPPYGALDYVEWPQGVFLLSSPKRRAERSGRVVREVDGFDQTQRLLDDKIDFRLHYNAGANAVFYATDTLTDLGLLPRAVADTAQLPTAREWEPGTPYLKIVNELLGIANYQSLSFDENGAAVVEPYVSPQERSPEYVYADDEDGLIIPQVDQMMDLFDIANKWTLVVSEPDRDELIASYTNNDPGSPTSTVNRGRTIVDFRKEQDAADLTTLQAKAARLAFEASQVYEVIEFDTALMPIHSGNDVLHIRYAPLAIDDKYSETSWSMQLKAGVPMQHRVRRVVNVSE